MRFEDQDDLAAYSREKLSEQVRRVEELTQSLDAEQRRQPREDGGWSVDQILRHLARMNETYLAQLEPLADETSADASPTRRGGPARRWEATIGGRLLRWSVTTSFSLKTPRIFRPETLEYEGDALQAFTASQSRLLTLLDEMRDMKWSALRCASPASALIRLNAGDAFLVLAEHGERHLGQLEGQVQAVGGVGSGKS